VVTSPVPPTERPEESAGQLVAPASQEQVKGVLLQTGELLPVPTVDLPIQLAFTPMMGGGSTHFMACYDSTAIPAEPKLFPLSLKQGPDGRMPFSSLAAGNSLILCYVAFTPGSITERVFGPDGREIRVVTFTIDPLAVIQEQVIMGLPPEVTVAANDFTALPFDTPGTYTVMAETPDGNYTTSFELRDDVEIGPNDLTMQGTPFVAPLGHGVSAESIQGADYIVLAGFASEDRVAISLFETCSWNGRANYQLQSTMLAMVGPDGRAFVRIPPELADQLQPSPAAYLIIARGERTPLVNGGEALYDARMKEEQGYEAIINVAPWYSAASLPANANRASDAIDRFPACSG